jgi:hypothetical protein
VGFIAEPGGAQCEAELLVELNDASVFGVEGIETGSGR